VGTIETKVEAEVSGGGSPLPKNRKILMRVDSNGFSDLYTPG